jgi:ABC-type transport system involved in multi-copper enzyme maturation permease subunit
MKVPYIAWLTFHEARRLRLLLVGLALGLAFLALYAVSFYFLHRDLVQSGRSVAFAVREMSSTFTMMGLYAVNFLVVMVSVLASVDTISGEIASHSIQSIVTKPIRRWEVVLGKWLGFAVMIAATVLLLAGGVIFISWAVSSFVPTNIVPGLMLMIGIGWILLAVTLLGGTLFSTLTNGVVVFMLFILAFMGGWTEQIGALIHNDTAVNIGILSSLLMPTEALWRRAAYQMQPPSLTGAFNSPFITTSLPSEAMVAYAILYGLAALGAAVWVFHRRDL